MILTLALTLWGPGPLRAGPAAAFNPIKPICSVAGWVSGIAGKACGAVEHGGQVVKAGKKLLSGHPLGALKTLFGGGSSTAGKAITVTAALTALGGWVLLGSRAAVREVAKAVSHTTSPRLTSTWFSGSYWRIAGLAVVLTLPFVFAAAVQALVRSDLALLARSTLGYLPLAILGISLAAPLTMLLLAASDQMSAVVGAAAGGAGHHFLTRFSTILTGIAVTVTAPFLVFLIGALTAIAAVVLWLELLMREAAVYIVVLMLPLAFAAMVWPARRVWAIRVVEVLVALILSKFAMVAVLALGAAALGQGGAGGVSGMLAGLVLLILASMAPWALMRLLPMTELAVGAAGHLRGELSGMRGLFQAADAEAGGGAVLVAAAADRVREQAQEAWQRVGPADDPPSPDPEDWASHGDDPGGSNDDPAAARDVGLPDRQADGLGAEAGGEDAAGTTSFAREGRSQAESDRAGQAGDGTPRADDVGRVRAAAEADSPAPEADAELWRPYVHTDEDGMFVLGPEGFPPDTPERADEQDQRPSVSSPAGSRERGHSPNEEELRPARQPPSGGELSPTAEGGLSPTAEENR